MSNDKSYRRSSSSSSPCHTNFAVMTTLYFALVPQKF
ncbi:MAG: hypothetical protein JWP02_354 [Acidimicrobiales bacterium]|nr:hypothetical protein [Acidimicrobiales bacterium]